MDLDALTTELVRDEGLRLTPYTDTVGKLTIGVGRNLTDVGISKAEALDLLAHDIDACVADLTSSFPWFARLDDVRQRVLLNMRFNLGPTRFRQFRQMLAAVQAGDYVKASEQMQSSRWAEQVKGRAQRLVRMMATGVALLLFAVNASAQSHVDVVTSVKANLESRGINLSGPCGAFQIVKRVAWQLRDEGAGLLLKPTGNQCESRATDVIVYRDGKGFDVLRDAGGENGPVWNPVPIENAGARWVAPSDPGDGPMLPPPPPVPAAELQPLLDAIEELKIQVAAVQGQVNAHEGFHARIAELERQHEQDNATFYRTVETISARLQALTCKASVFGVPIHCEVK